MLGKKLMKQELGRLARGHHNQITDIGGLPPGVLYLRLVEEGEVPLESIKRIVVN